MATVDSDKGTITPAKKAPAKPAPAKPNPRGPDGGAGGTAPKPGAVNRPGFVPSAPIRDASGHTAVPGVDAATYAHWSQGITNPNSPLFDPFTTALIKAYGAPFQAFAWQAYIGEMDDIDYQNNLIARFPNYVNVIKGIGGTGSPGGSRGGGGGGGGGTAAPTPEQIAAAKAAVKNRAGELGHTALTDDELTWVATTVVRDGWNSAQLDDWLLGDPTKVTEPGLVTATVDQIRQMAANQLLTVSDVTAREWSDRINSGEMTTDAVLSIFQQQALGEFGWAADSIKAGISMRDMLAPARDQIAKELELTPETVDLMDPKWRSMVTVTDPKGGAVRAATLTEVTRSARKSPEWAKTNTSKSLAANTFMLVRNMFEGS